MDNDIKIGENHIYILYIMLVKKEIVIMYKERQVIALFTKKEAFQDILWIIAENIALSIGVAWFILPNNVLTGGLAGFAIALQKLIPLSPELIINIGTVGLFLVGVVILGKKFAMKTIVSTICYPMLLSLCSFIATKYFPADTFIMDNCI